MQHVYKKNLFPLSYPNKLYVSYKLINAKYYVTINVTAKSIITGDGYCEKNKDERPHSANIKNIRIAFLFFNPWYNWNFRPISDSLKD